MIDYIIIFGYIVGMAAFLVSIRINIAYRITPTHLVVSLFGINMRQIRLDDIKSVSMKRVFLAESWCNALSTRNRRLVIHRHTGWFKTIVISPSYRFVFRNELVEARRRIHSWSAKQTDFFPASARAQILIDTLKSLLPSRIPAILRRPFKTRPAAPNPQFFSN